MQHSSLLLGRSDRYTTEHVHTALPRGSPAAAHPVQRLHVSLCRFKHRLLYEHGISSMTLVSLRAASACCCVGKRMRSAHGLVVSYGTM